MIPKNNQLNIKNLKYTLEEFIRIAKLLQNKDQLDICSKCGEKMRLIKEAQIVRYWGSIDCAIGKFKITKLYHLYKCDECKINIWVQPKP